VGDPVSWACDPSAHPQDPSAIGLDCSGFARWVYDLAYGQDVLGSGGTGTQIGEMNRVSSPVAGDLVFFGASASSTEHVGVYIGGGEMINAFETGTQVQTNAVSDGGNLIGYYQY
jgi:cell wall-associated NlpC family hydrolase